MSVSREWDDGVEASGEAIWKRPRATALRGSRPQRRPLDAEHDAAGQQVARLRELTGGFEPDADSCNTHRALLAALAELERDLREHVHKENNVLFPRARALQPRP